MTPRLDRIFQSNGVTLFDQIPSAIRYLRGAEVDFVDNLTGGGFTIKNPNAKSTCGCGTVVAKRRKHALQWAALRPIVQDARLRAKIGDSNQHSAAVLTLSTSVSPGSVVSVQT